MNKRVKNRLVNHRFSWQNKIFLAIFIFFIIISLLAISLKIACRPNQLSPIQNTNTRTPEMQNIISTIKDYSRSEESTYLTYPEWYIVFSAQEYADFLRSNLPSNFPYFASIGQYWCSYNYAYVLTKDTYVFNSGNHLMLSVIGVSYSIEYAAKGIYELTIGKVFELLSFNTITDEDRYATNVAREYGEFLPHTPWYEFPFGSKLMGVWKDIPIFGPYPHRKLERKLLLSAEYGVKALYASVIKVATEKTYGVPDHSLVAIALWTAPVPDDVVQKEKNIIVLHKLQDGSYIIELPRYKKFRDTIPVFGRENIQMYEIGGNDEIMATVIVPKQWTNTLPNTVELFTQTILTKPQVKRVALKIPVRSLHNTLAAIEKENIKLEHIYDY